MIKYDYEQRSVEWFAVRSGMPTASEFKNLIKEQPLLKADIVSRLSGLEDEKTLSKMTVGKLTELANENGVDLSPSWVTSENSYHYLLAAEVLAGCDPDPWIGNEHTEHGNDWEKEAVKKYEEMTGVKTEVVGFVTNDEKTSGCSPDRLVGEDGLLEVKSPLARNMVKTWCEEMAHGVCPKEYKVQIQGQLWITGRAWCDLLLSHPSLGEKVLRVYPDQEIFNALSEAVKTVSKKRDLAVIEMSGF